MDRRGAELRSTSSLALFPISPSVSVPADQLYKTGYDKARPSMASSPYRNISQHDSNEGFPLTPRSSTDSLTTDSTRPRMTPSRSNSDVQYASPSKLVRLESSEDSQDEDGEFDQPRLTLYDASWSEEPDEREQGKRDRRRRNRRVYGGGRHRHAEGDADEEQDDEDDGGGGNEDMTVGEVTGLIFAGTYAQISLIAVSQSQLTSELARENRLSPLPLLVPYACFALTPALFVPLLALSGVLAWSSAVALGVQGRYVGAR